MTLDVCKKLTNMNVSIPMPDPNPLLPLSALGIYFHAIYISLTSGLPVAIGVMLWKCWRTGDRDFYRAARLMTAVLR